MPKVLLPFKEMKVKMKMLKGQTNYEIACDMETTERHLYECVSANKIPYKGVINWCLEHDVPLEDILTKEK